MNDVCHRHDDDSRGVWLRDRDISHIWHDKTKSPNRSEIPNGQCNQSVINLNDAKISSPSPSLEVVFLFFFFFFQLHHVHSVEDHYENGHRSEAYGLSLSICRWWINDRLRKWKARFSLSLSLSVRLLFSWSNAKNLRDRQSTRPLKIFTVISCYRLIERRERMASLSAWSLTTLMTDRGDRQGLSSTDETDHFLAIRSTGEETEWQCSRTRSVISGEVSHLFSQWCIWYDIQPIRVAMIRDVYMWQRRPRKQTLLVGDRLITYQVRECNEKKECYLLVVEVNRNKHTKYCHIVLE